jgi:chemotaxis protein MotA
MDLATLIGLVLAVASVLVSIMLAAPLSAFVDYPSLAIVLGGTIASTLINFSMGQFVSVFKVIKKTFLYPLPAAAAEISRLVSYANLARRGGLLALEEKIEEVDDEFLGKGLRMVIDGLPAEEIRSVLENELVFLQERHVVGKKLLDTMGSSAPAFGMIGTLIGLVAMLRAMDDPSSIGVGMAVALLTTLYGSFFANVFFIPMSGKLERRSQEEGTIRYMTLEGILSIQAGDKPQLVEEKLKAFLAPGKRETADAA